MTRLGAKSWAALLLTLGAGIAALVAWALHTLPPGQFADLEPSYRTPFCAATIAAGALYAAAVWIVGARRLPPWALPAALILGVLPRLLVVAAPPVFSNDVYRYIWDGKVQAAGINPYRYLPIDPALAPLRDPARTPPNATSIYPNINRPDYAHTIYPPAAQAVFALVGLTAPTLWTMKAVMLAFDLLTAGLAMLLLREAGRPMIQALVWLWNPLVIWELSGGGHIDATASAATAAALLLAIRARPGWAGAALGVAVLFKLLPAVLFPALWRKWDWRTPLAAAAVIVGAYACYASVGWGIFGYLAGYTREERLVSGGALIPHLLELQGAPKWVGPAYTGACLVALAALAAWISLRRPLPLQRAPRAEMIGRDALILAAATLAVLSPYYPWYLTMLVLPAVLRPAWSALWPTIAAPLLYIDYDPIWRSLVFFPALAILATELWFRRSPPALLAQGDP